MRSIYHAPVLFRSLLMLFCLLLFLCSPIFSQHTVKGRITGKDGIPLAGATITSKETIKTTITDSTGQFTITANPRDLFEISCIGYRTRKLALNNETEINISLTETIVTLDDIVLVGYGSSQRKDVTGSVTKVLPKDFNVGIITNPLQQLQGKVAGLVIVQPGGDPNGDLIVRLRGATSLEGQPPLLVIDGVALDDFNKTVSTLNPADIESYDILKDASASAIYGSRGANGVILVTTKKNRAGKTLVEYNGFIGMENISNQINVINAEQWRKATATMNAGSLDKGASTDWQKSISQTGMSQSHLMGISGGSDQFNYRGSVGYISQQGVIINSGKEIFTARLTAEQKSNNSKLNIRYAINASTINRDFLPDQHSTTQARSGGAFVFNQVLQYLPVWPVNNPDGSFYQPPSNIINPVFLVREIYSKQRENFFQASAIANYEVLKGLKLGVLAALSRGNDTYDRFWPALPGTNGSGEAEKSSNNQQSFTGDIHGNYQKIFGKNTIDITGVYEYNQFINDGFGVTARGFQVPAILNNNLGTATNISPNDIHSYKYETKLISFLGRVVYTYNDRYIITASLRRDGSSKFGPNYRWGNFPSVAVAWRANKENFLQHVKWLDNLKLRVSYGYTGNQENLPPNNYQTIYGPAGPYINNGQIYQSYAGVQENNPDLKWEVRKSFNIGVDFSILRDRIYGIIDLFNDKTSDMLFLYDLPQPPFLSNTVYANAASAANKGVEITLGAAIVKNKDFGWNIQANIGFLKNSITNLLGEFKGSDLSLTNRHYGYAFGGGFGGTYVTQLEVGYPAGVFWIPQHAGIDAAGHELFNNYDANGKLTGSSTEYSDQDRVFIDPTPNYSWGVTNNFRYQNFDLSFFLRGVQGQKIFANSILNLENINYLPGRNVTEKALTNGFTDLPQPSTYWLRNGSYARLENITLGYQFKNLKGISNLRVYLTATNLMVINSYDGIDPEINTDGSQRYIDQNYYPKTRGFLFGANIAF